jgi:hypothetical protein
MFIFLYLSIVTVMCIRICECVQTVNCKKITANSDMSSALIGNLLSRAHNFVQIPVFNIVNAMA